MFIPRGNSIHKNLATSYLLIEALVEDLCIGGFSGAIEILFRASDCYIIIERGKVAAAVERRENGAPSRTTVSLLAARSRTERGQVSIYGYSADTALALAGRVAAEQLYAGLSTDFADLEKMLAKLSRERDRQWFVEVNTASGLTALIHLDDERCSVITEGESGEAEAAGVEESSALRRLLDECNRAGARFDVFFKRAAQEEPVDLLTTESPACEDAAEPAEQEITIEEGMVAAVDSGPPPDSPHFSGSIPTSTQPHEPYVNPPPQGDATEDRAREETEPSYVEAPEPAPDTNALIKGLGPNTIRLLAMPSMIDETEEQMSSPDARTPADATAARARSEDEKMIEIKRLMGEVARTIEEAARAAEPPGKFPMYLRAGQLKIADRFPFLDPFGAEFEYLGGEIAFIGKTSPEEFIAGLTEALKLAVVGVAQSSGQPARLRNQIADDLRRLKSRAGPEIEHYGLDRSIDEIINS
jgi:hypothetical protein